MTDKADALAAWATAFAAREGRLPRVWMDELCASPALLPAELLAHLPVYMAQCAKLLVLASPTFGDRLLCATEVYLWTEVLGARLDDIQIVLVQDGGAEAASATQASFDTFHVDHATFSGADYTQTLAALVQIATPARFNRALRALTPLVQEAVRVAATARTELRSSSV
jgi:hypothetical protein